MNGTSLEKKKKGFALPDTYVIVAILVIFMALMTYVIPAGVFDTVTNESGQTMVDPNSFHFVERTSTSLKDLLFSFYTGVLINAVVAFIPLGLAVAEIMKLDRVSAMAFLYLGTYAGFNSSFMSASSVQIAQQMAELPLLSGMGFRVVVTAIIVLITIIYVMRYAVRVSKDPSRSIMPVSEYPFDENLSAEVNDTFTVRDVIIILLVFGGLALYVYGCIKFAWGYDYMALSAR